MLEKVAEYQQTIKTNELIEQLQKYRASLDHGSFITPDIYIKKVESIISKIERGYYKQVGKASLFNVGLDELARDLKSIGFYDLAQRVLHSEYFGDGEVDL